MHASDEEDFSKTTKKTRVKAFSEQNSTNGAKCKTSHLIYMHQNSGLIEIYDSFKLYSYRPVTT